MESISDLNKKYIEKNFSYGFYMIAMENDEVYYSQMYNSQQRFNVDWDNISVTKKGKDILMILPTIEDFITGNKWSRTKYSFSIPKDNNNKYLTTLGPGIRVGQEYRLVGSFIKETSYGDILFFGIMKLSNTKHINYYK